ncbi:hypothetical protein DY000_02035576 [Brassica cretica]|uniref:C2H2-type domain-containing protein n=1 Tax=Brassica cretica TaxID=69181 RepID=A0ABQ7DMY5_BRACR|nr:hypothetical protein DY000_02035576 [Brassica cretica]
MGRFSRPSFTCLYRNKKVDFIKKFNIKLFVKQQDIENLQILDAHNAELIEVSITVLVGATGSINISTILTGKCLAKIKASNGFPKEEDCSEVSFKIVIAFWELTVYASDDKLCTFDTCSLKYEIASVLPDMYHHHHLDHSSLSPPQQ